MSMVTLVEIERNALGLPKKQREELAGRLMQSLSKEPPNDVDSAWVAEAERRFTSYLRGERTAVTARTAIARMKKSLR
jgi:hypothetical protein